VQTSLLFPGYFFVAIDEGNPQWRAVMNTVGVSRIVMKKQGVPARMPPQLLDGLAQRCDEDGFLLPPSELQAGDTVRISNGPFSQFIATVERVEPERRVWVLLDLLGSERAVEVRLDDLSASCG
jgi:transcriptional antiterminator RfaH